MENFTEKIIEHVKKHDALFNLAHPDYKNVRIKNKIWDEIAEELKLGSTGGEHLKKRWKSLRDCYSKYLRSEKTRTGQQAKSVNRYKTWPWAQHMEVFRSYIQFAQTESNVLDTEIVESPRKLNEETELLTQTLLTENIQKEPSVEVNRLSPKIADRVGSKRKLLERTPQASSVDKIIQFLEEKHFNIDKQNEIDLVFLGYAASVKKLPSRSQTLIKFNIAKMIMEEELLQQAEMEEERRPGTSSTFHSSTLSSSTNISIGSPDDNTSHVPSVSSGQEHHNNGCPAEVWYNQFAQNIS